MKIFFRNIYSFRFCRRLVNLQVVGKINFSLPSLYQAFMPIGRQLGWKNQFGFLIQTLLSMNLEEKIATAGVEFKRAEDLFSDSLH